MYPQQELSHSVSVEFVKLYLRGSIQQYRGAHRLVPTFAVIADRPTTYSTEKTKPQVSTSCSVIASISAKNALKRFIRPFLVGSSQRLPSSSKVYKNLAKFFWQLSKAVYRLTAK
jgi:hypothetical protein